MKINNSSSVNFNGYKNLITNTARVSKDELFSFLSMQLDNVGSSDLEIWKNIQKQLFSIKNPSDVFTVELSKGFGLISLYMADKNINPNFYQKKSEKEMYLMKAYTWMSNLMKRVMNENHPIKDKGAFDVFHKTIANILPIFNNNIRTANEFVILSQNPSNHPQETALLVRESIDKIMQDYFS